MLVYSCYDCVNNNLLHPDFKQMINCAQLRELIIKPTLDALQLNSEDAVELLIFTCAVESDGGTYLKQIKGNALGIYQMEVQTYNDIWQNYLNNNGSLLLKLTTNFSCMFMPPEDRLVYDLYFATAMARIHYRRVKEPLPPKHNTDKIWAYYKKYYNTVKGASTKQTSIDKYTKYIQA